MQKYKKFLLQYKKFVPRETQKRDGSMLEECLQVNSDKIMGKFAVPFLSLKK